MKRKRRETDGENEEDHAGTRDFISIKTVENDETDEVEKIEEIAVVLESFLTEEEINFLINDLITFEQIFQEKLGHDDYGDYGAAIDPFEFISIPPRSLIRSQKTDYLEARWKSTQKLTEEHSCTQDIEKNRSLFASIAFNRIPNIVKQCTSSPDPSSSLYLFNEQYIIKKGKSDIAFRWHRDVDEQLGAVFHPQRLNYFSVWCNLDPVHERNGTIAFQNSAKIIRLTSMKDLDSSISLLSDASPSLSSVVPSEEERGIELSLPPGSLVLFGSHVWHRSGRNLDSLPRRVFYAQYSYEPIVVASANVQSNNAEELPEYLSFAVKID